MYYTLYNNYNYDNNNEKATRHGKAHGPKGPFCI